MSLRVPFSNAEMPQYPMQNAAVTEGQSGNPHRGTVESQVLLGKIKGEPEPATVPSIEDKLYLRKDCHHVPKGNLKVPKYGKSFFI